MSNLNNIPPHMSFSAMKEYKSCAHKFAHRKVWKTPVEKAPLSYFLHLGNAFHGWLQDDPYMSEDEFEKAAGIETLTLLQELQHAWTEADTSVYDNAIAQFQMNEVEFNFVTPVGLIIKGFIDIVGMDADGNIHLIEIKTGKKPYPKKYLDQLELYESVWHESVLQKKPLVKKPGWDKLPTSKILVMQQSEPPFRVNIKQYMIEDDETVTKDIPIRKMDDVWSSILRSIESNEFEKNAQFLCKWCDYQKICNPWGSLLRIKTP